MNSTTQATSEVMAQQRLVAARNKRVSSHDVGGEQTRGKKDPKKEQPAGKEYAVGFIMLALATFFSVLKDVSDVLGVSTAFIFLMPASLIIFLLQFCAMRLIDIGAVAMITRLFIVLPFIFLEMLPVISVMPFTTLASVITIGFLFGATLFKRVTHV